MNFLNAKQFKSNDIDVFTMRKKRYVKNLKILALLFIFGFVSTVVSLFMLSPLTISQRNMTFRETSHYLYGLMHVKSALTTLISSVLAMTGSFYLSTMICLVTLEFKVLRLSFKKLLKKIEDDLDENEIKRIINEMKDCVAYHQRLLQ